MSASAQSLYFHLGMAADDDGVVEAFMVMRTIKAMEDDFRVLVAKGFIKPLNEDQVSYILDWNEHNLIRSDRLIPSIHRELLVKVIPDIELVQPRIRADLARLGTGRPMDNQRTAQDRIGEGNIPANADSSEDIRIEADGEEKPRATKDPATVQYESLLRWAEARRGFKFINRTKQYGALKKARLNEISITRLKERWQECEGESWRDGFDWTNVMTSFDKKP